MKENRTGEMTRGTILLATAQCTTFFTLKDVERNPGFQVISQNEAGPCSIVAIMNILILRGKVELPSNTNNRTISSDWIKTTATNYLRLKAKAMRDKSSTLHLVKDAAELDAIDDKMIIVLKTIFLIPKLFQSIGVDPIFTSNSKFTTGIAAVETFYFQAFDIHLKHAWVIDPVKDHEVSNAVLSFGDSYEQVTAALFVTNNETAKATKWQQLARDWIRDSEGAQVTKYGLKKLGTAANLGYNVLYMGSHFHVIFRTVNDCIKIIDTAFVAGNSTEWRFLEY